MSHLRHVAVLAHYQPLDTRPATHVAPGTADLLVQRMIAERITQRLIRMLPPDSIFPVAEFRPERRCYVPEKLPPKEVANVKFQLPASLSNSTVPRLRGLPRFREIFGDQQLAASL